MTLSRDDLELVLAMPEGEARNEVLSELANPEPFEGSGADDAGVDAFMPSLDDLPVERDSAPDASAVSDGFMPSLEDLPGGVSRRRSGSWTRGTPSRCRPSRWRRSSLPSGELAEGQSPLELAVTGGPAGHARAAIASGHGAVREEPGA